MSASRNTIVWAGSVAIGLLIGWSLRPGPPESEASPEQGQATRKGGLSPRDRAAGACRLGKPTELLASLSAMGPGAEELFLSWIKESVRLGLVESHADAVKLYRDLALSGTSRTVIAALEVMGEFSPDSVGKIAELLGASPESLSSVTEVEALMRGYVRHDKQVALRGLGSLPEGIRNLACRGFLAAVGDSGRHEALKFAFAGLPGFPPERGVEAVLDDWFKDDPETAVKAVTPEMAGMSPLVGAMLIRHQIKHGASMEDLKAAGSKGEGSVTWAGLLEYATGPPDDFLTLEQARAIAEDPRAAGLPARKYALSSMLYSRPDEALSVIEAMPLNAARDGNVTAVFRTIATRDPAAAMQFLARENRDRPSANVQMWYGDFFKTWLNTDPAAALEAMKSVEDSGTQATLERLMRLMHQREFDVDWMLVDAVKAAAEAPVIGPLKDGLVPEGERKDTGAPQ